MSTFRTSAAEYWLTQIDQARATATGGSQRSNLIQRSLVVLSDPGTARARNALREADAPVFAALRRTAARRLGARECRVICPLAARNAPRTPGSRPAPFRPAGLPGAAGQI